LLELNAAILRKVESRGNTKFTNPRHLHIKNTSGSVAEFQRYVAELRFLSGNK